MSSLGPAPSGPRPPKARDPRRSAAVWLWVVAGLEVVLFGCCSLCSGVIGLTPEATIQDAAAKSQMPAEQLEQILAMQPLAVLGAILMMVVIVLPGLALALLAFGVRQGRRRTTIASLVIVGIQLGFVVLEVLSSIVQPAAFVIKLLIYGPFTALLIFTLIKLKAALHPGPISGGHYPGRYPGESDEPWNDHLG